MCFEYNAKVLIIIYIQKSVDSALSFAVAPKTVKAQSHDLEGKKVTVHIPIMYTYLAFTLLFSFWNLPPCSTEQSLFFNSPKETDWLIDRKDRMKKAKIFPWKRLEHTWATWAVTLVAPLIFNGTVWARYVARLASVTKLGGGNDPVVVEALPLSALASFVATHRALTPRAPASPSCGRVPGWEKVDVFQTFINEKNKCLKPEIFSPEVALQGAAPPEAAIVSSIQVLTW